jgi:hypothetical protein
MPQFNQIQANTPQQQFDHCLTEVKFLTSLHADVQLNDLLVTVEPGQKFFERETQQRLVNH